jgi:hypothetical protein
VLEGGYSIEGALPYVNVGIILALAGLDFSHVKEPDYDPEKLRQTPDVTQHIKKVADRVMEYWHQVPELKEKLLNQGGLKERERTIYYDTDNILENQREKIRVCTDCSGVWAIESWTDRGRRIYAVHVPRKACSTCENLGYEWYENASLKLFDCVFIQDRKNRRFLTRRHPD